MKTPIFITNFKVYKSGTGEEALSLAHLHQEIGTKFGVNVICAVQAVDIRMISSLIKTPVIAQHIDGVPFGKHSGHILPEAVKEAGAIGTLVNHSEYRISDEEIKKAIERCGEIGLAAICCAETPEEGERLLSFNPDFIAIEPPDLIGGNVSVATRPDVIQKAVSLIGKEKLIIGAGIKTADDIKKGMALGAIGVLVSSGIMETQTPEKVLTELVKALC